MSKRSHIRIGVVVNTTMKPSRDVLHGIAQGLYSRTVNGRPCTLSFFLGSAGTKIENLLEFASQGMDALIFNGIARPLLFRFLQSMPNHPPVVFATYSPLSKDEWAVLGNGGVVMLDNRAIGHRAADFFIARGLSNFAMMGRVGYREDVAGRIRRDAFHERLREKLDTNMTYTEKFIGVFHENEDYWETNQDAALLWLASLPRPCGVFVNGDHLAFKVAAACKRLDIPVPDLVEILGIDNNDGFCDNAVPAVSRIVPDIAAFADKALELALSFIKDPRLACERRFVEIASTELIERGSTAFSRGYGHLAVRAKEYIRTNACRGIKVPDVANALGVSRRTLEIRVLEATGKTVLSLIADIKMAKLCHLLAQTEMPILDVIAKAGYSPSRNVFVQFKKRYGQTMKAYRTNFKK